MNDERFLQFQKSIDDDILEEAAAYHKQKIAWGRYVALAACFCGVIAGVLAWHPWSSAKNTAVMASGANTSAETAAAYSVFDAAAPAAPEPEEVPEAAMSGTEEGGWYGKAAEPSEVYEEAADESIPQENESVMTFGAVAEDEGDNSMGIGESAAIPNPIRECTLEDLSRMGYRIDLPDGAESAFVAVIGDMADVRFLYGGNEYLLRVLRTAEPEDISGVYDTVRKAYSWGENGTDFEMREGSEGIVFSWYAHDDGTQWCLFSRDAGPEALLKTAGEIRGAEVPAPQE